MEEWQRKHITDNLTVLIFLTKFTSAVKAAFEANGIVSQADIDSLVSLLKNMPENQV